MRQKLGQHFLINSDKLREIAAALRVRMNDTVIEVGPGHGELTDAILAENQKLKIIALEKDRDLADNLKAKYVQDARVEIIEGDARKILPEVVQKIPKTRAYKLAGNIPYYLTGYLLRIISELTRKPAIIVLTIQKEVAERIVAKPPQMNLLAASIQVWATPQIIGIIPRKDFSPPPQVESAILTLAPHKNILTRKEAEGYYRAIKIVFKQPRKTILNNILSGIARERAETVSKLEHMGIAHGARPSNLSSEELRALARAFDF